MKRYIFQTNPCQSKKDGIFLESVPKFLKHSTETYTTVYEVDQEHNPVPIETFLRDKGILQQCLKVCGESLKYVQNPDYSECLLAVRQNGLVLRRIEVQTDELCFEAYKSNKLAIQYIRTFSPTLCFALVAIDTWCLSYIKQQSEELQLLALRKNPSSVRYFQPLTKRMYTLAVIQNGGVLKHIPKSQRNEELCLIALLKNGGVLKHIENPTPSMVALALSKDGTALKYVKNPSLTECASAVQQNGLALQFVPPEKQTPYVCLLAMDNNPASEKYITIFQA